MTTDELLYAIIDSLLAVLSEAAVEIANLDSPQNPVCVRLRAAIQKLDAAKANTAR